MPWPSAISLSSGLPLRRAESTALAMADEELRDIAGSGELEERIGRVAAFQNFDVRAGGVGNGEAGVEGRLILGGDIRLFDVGHHEFAMKSLGDDLRGRHHSCMFARGVMQTRIRSCAP